MKYSDLISGLFWLSVGLLLSFWSMSYKIGSFIQPGPGLLPLGLGFLLIFLSLILLLGQMKRSSLITEKKLYFSPSGGWKKVGYTVLILLLAIFFFEKIGYLFTFFLLIIFLTRGTGPQSWRKILLIAFLSTLGVYLVFVLLLEQPLPRGLLGI